MTGDDVGNGRDSWATRVAPKRVLSEQEMLEIRVRRWWRVSIVLAGVLTILAGVVFTTLSNSLAYETAFDENLRLKQDVQEIEGQLTDVDRILVRLRLYDARLKSLAGETDSAAEESSDGTPDGDSEPGAKSQ